MGPAEDQGQGEHTVVCTQYRHPRTVHVRMSKLRATCPRFPKEHRCPLLCLPQLLPPK